MSLPMHAGYKQLVAKADASHEQGRSSRDITDDDVALARLYSYAFRIHTIGAYHATRVALEAAPQPDPLANAHLHHAGQTLQDLANQGMEPVPDDFRAVVSTFYRYHRQNGRVVDAIEQAHAAGRDRRIGQIGDIFNRTIAQISTGTGIHLTQDLEAPEQASFIVPNLGITIIPLVYGDHHSWNKAHLNEQNLDVPWHRHHQGVEIHLGYAPLEGYMILDQYKALVSEGYALPIAPMTRHGWANTTGNVHHVPFIFGSLKQAGWGVFLDVEAQPMPLEDFKEVDRASWQMGGAVYLEREIDTMARLNASRRQVLIPASVTNRQGSGGLELSVSRATETGLTLPPDTFRAVSVVRGQGIARVGPAEQQVQAHDHFAVPAGMAASVRQTGNDPLVVLDALIKDI